MIASIIQARASSKRLPGKVLLPLGGVTILEYTVGRVRGAKSIGEIIVATSNEKSDDEIESLCKTKKIPYFRGDLNDVLDRYYRAANTVGAKHICRVTADCPFIDPHIIDRVADEYNKGDCDYISTGRLNSTFPDGMDTEIFSTEALEKAWREAKLPSEREHVTPYIWNHPELFRLREIRNNRDLSKIRLTVDEPADYEVLKNIVANVHELSMDGIVRYLEEHPEIVSVNSSIVRNQGYLQSISEESKN